MRRREALALALALASLGALATGIGCKVFASSPSPELRKPMSTLLETIEKETGPNPTVAIIWMHGLGADANDFVPMLHELDLAGLPAIRFIFPNADTMPVTVNGGYVMRSWYDIVASDLGRQEDAAGLRASQLKVEALMAREKPAASRPSASSWPVSRRAAR